jgi:hypothetical protein
MKARREEFATLRAQQLLGHRAVWQRAEKLTPLSGREIFTPPCPFGVMSGHSV